MMKSFRVPGLLLAICTLLGACANPSITEIESKGNRLIVSKSGVGGEGGPMSTCMVVEDRESGKVKQMHCTGGRGTLQGVAEGAVPAALLGGLGVWAAKSAPDPSTNITVDGSSASAGAGASANIGNGRPRPWQPPLRPFKFQ